MYMVQISCTLYYLYLYVKLTMKWIKIFLVLIWASDNVKTMSYDLSLYSEYGLINNI